MTVLNKSIANGVKDLRQFHYGSGSWKGFLSNYVSYEYHLLYESYDLCLQIPVGISWSCANPDKPHTKMQQIKLNHCGFQQANTQQVKEMARVNYNAVSMMYGTCLMI